MKWKTFLKSALGLIEALSISLLGGIGINYKYLKIKCSDLDSKLSPLEYKSRQQQLHQPARYLQASFITFVYMSYV